VSELPSNWGRFGDSDELGTVNLLTEEAVLRGVAAVKTGRRYTLNLPQDLPRDFGRPPLEKITLAHNADFHGMVVNDDSVVMALQGSTQWDALAHAGLADPSGQIFYNGFSEQAVDDQGIARHLGIDKLAQRGIAGRGVLLDVARLVSGGGEDPLDEDFLITEQVVQDCLSHQQMEIASGDIICLRTGWAEAYLSGSAEQRHNLTAPSPGGDYARSAGVSPDLARLARQQDWAALVGDNPAVERVPPPEGWARSGHVTMLRNLGLLLGEMFHFGPLAAAAADDRRWDFFFVAVPLFIPGGLGSPGCAMAIR
jgi:hypothetical protein